MKIFVTGATGVLGQSATPLLVRGGHDVRALARSEHNVTTVRALGAEPFEGSLFDAAAMREAVRDRDAVLHLATRIPPSNKVRQKSFWRENDRIRSEGTRILVDAALAANVPTFIYPSVTFLYPDAGDAWIDATSREPDSAWFLDSTLVAEAEVNRFAAAAGDRRGVTLRMGPFYGPSSSHTQEILKLAKRGYSAILGRPESYMAAIWIDDAARAVVAAALEQAPSGIYDIVDDEPLQRRELAAVLAEGVGRKRLRRVPVQLAKLLAGKLVEVNARSQRVSNARFKAVTSWTPTVPNTRVGFAKLREQPVTATRQEAAAVR